jgi:hypothetical protein
MSGADIAAAMMLCLSYFAGTSVMCDATIGGRCHWEWTVPECSRIEAQYYAPGGPADQAEAGTAEAASKARDTLRELMSR